LGAAHAVLLPAVQSASDAAALARIYRQHFGVLVMFASAVIVAAWGAGVLLPWIDQGRYPDAVPAFRVLCASAIISFACSPHVNVLMKLQRFRLLLYLVLGGLGVAVALLIALVPLAGAVGAAWATLIAAACINVPIFLIANGLRGQLRGGEAA
jgi:O-antigen/teichoic acid export membrane protein